MNDRDPKREPREPSDVPGHGRVGEIDDPVLRTEYGDNRGAIREQAAAEAATRTPDDQPTNVVLYYLPVASKRTRDLRYRINHEDAIPTLAEFAAHYKRVGEDRVDKLHEVWERWNRGNGRESRAFVAAECRSLSVVDIVILDGDSYLCAPFGWHPIPLDERDQEADP